MKVLHNFLDWGYLNHLEQPAVLCGVGAKQGLRCIGGGGANLSRQIIELHDRRPPFLPTHNS